MAIQGEGIDAAKELGILEEIRKWGVERVIQRIERCDGTAITSNAPAAKGEGYTISRNQLHQILLKKVHNIEFGISAEKIKNADNGKEVEFSDGKKEIFDLVIAADGINSILRPLLNPGKSVFNSGLSVWNVHVKDYFPTIIEIWNNRLIAAFYPLPEGTSVSFFVKKPFTSIKESGSRKEDIKHFFKDCTHPEIERILEKCDDGIFFGSVRNVITPTWYRDRILLTGDAAHGVSPLSGMGANLAMADAAGIGKGLSEPEIHMDDFVQYRKQEAYKAFKTGQKRKRRALLKAPLSIVRNRTISSGNWNY